GTITVEPCVKRIIPAAATAVATVGTCLMTWTGGTLTANKTPYGAQLKSAAGSPAGTVLNAVPVGNLLTVNTGLTPSTTRTYQMQFSGWYLQMFGLTFAWLYAYTGNVLYQTWANRSLGPTTAIADASLKNWGETWGGARQGALYYRPGRTVRGTPGAHPTAIVNPPLQPELRWCCSYSWLPGRPSSLARRRRAP